MKKLILCFTLLMGVFSINAQSTQTLDEPRRNDIFIDPIMLIGVPMINVSYERLLNKDSGVGISAMIGFGEISKDFSQFSPYYRMYFGKKFAHGFFFEGFIPLTMLRGRTYHNNTNSYTTNTQTTIGIGVGFGGKWELKRNFMFEVSAGIGRKFGATHSYFDGPITGKGMLGIGKRF